MLSVRQFIFRMLFCVLPMMLLAAEPTMRLGWTQTMNETDAATAGCIKPRLIVLTDISSLETGVREPDDGQSMVRLMLYSNEIDIEGLIATSNLGHGQVVRPELIRQVVEAYGKVRSNLLLHSKEYPPVEQLLEGIKAGNLITLPKIPVTDSIGEGKDTEASEWIIRMTDRDDPRPLWIAVWGGTADLAQALWTVRSTQTPEELARFVGKLRIHSIGDQDSTGQWIKAEFPDLYVITRSLGIRGMYRGGDVSLASSEWVQSNIHGHGALGDAYPDYLGGDTFSSRLGRVRGVKEGDSPSILALIPNGLNLPDQPQLGGWGGREKMVDGLPHRWEDVADSDADPNDPDPRMVATYRWREAFQNDFAARLDWCIEPWEKANHAPIAKVAGEMRRTVRSGERIELDASASTDPDGDALSYEWWVYPALPEAALLEGNTLSFENPNAARTAFAAPTVTQPLEVPILLTVRDSGTPALHSYQRIMVTIQP
jgi:hypothetical protein